MHSTSVSVPAKTLKVRKFENKQLQLLNTELAKPHFKWHKLYLCTSSFEMFPFLSLACIRDP